MNYFPGTRASTVPGSLARTQLWALVAALVLPISSATAQAIAAAPGNAADGEADHGGGIDDIVVTARKKSENSRSVPIAITALSGAQLTSSNVARLTDFVSIIPNFTVSLAANQPLTFVRGFGSGGSWSFEQAVGKFVDNVSYGRDFDASRSSTSNDSSC